MNDVARWLVGAALALLLSVDSIGCGGFIQEYDDSSDEPLVGWCCDGLCGLSAEDATSLETTCSCAGVVAYRKGTIGDCIERTEP